jgi:hypothetical protein
MTSCFEILLRLSPWIPDFIYGFSSLEKKEIRDMLVKYFPVESYWGVFAGLN